MMVFDVISPLCPIFLFFKATLIILAIPFSPTFQVFISLLSFFEIDVSRESFGIP